MGSRVIRVTKAEMCTLVVSFLARRATTIFWTGNGPVAITRSKVNCKMGCSLRVVR
jgi:hypothetical protein